MTGHETEEADLPEPRLVASRSWESVIIAQAATLRIVRPGGRRCPVSPGPTSRMVQNPVPEQFQVGTGLSENQV